MGSVAAAVSARGHFCTVLCVVFFFFFFPTIAISVDTLAANQSLVDGQTLVSTNDMFEFGFFSPGSSTKRYLGIWYKSPNNRTVVWVANRDNPIITNSSGVTFKIGDAGNIVVLEQLDNLIWSSNQSKPANYSVVQLLGSGNLVLREEKDQDPENYLWQSFDYPTDTLLPDMKLGWDLSKGLDRNLTSWKSEDDPATGEYSVKLDFHGSPELIMRRQWNELVFRSGPWNGVTFSGIPEMTSTSSIAFNLFSWGDEVYCSLLIRDKLAKPMLVLNSNGMLRISYSIEEEGRQVWNQYWSAPKDNCDTYGLCGSYGICYIDNSPLCNCSQGFEPKNLKQWDLADWSDGCVRKTKLDCKTDGFLTLTGMRLPVSSSSLVDKTMMSLKGCREACLNNCSCTAYATSVGTGCVMWNSDLLDIREYTDGPELYVRLSASDLDVEKSEGTLAKKGILAVLVISATIVLFLCVLVGYCLVKRKVKGRLLKAQNELFIDAANSPGKEMLGQNRTNSDLPFYDLKTIVSATNNFSPANKLGQGGFGSVYKGQLVNGQEIAVKRLSKNSSQGIEEFKNEVTLIAKLQHRNLVRLLGCCFHKEEKMLIYEYLPNKSLDSFIFGNTRNILDWQKRFEIILGIARGVLYLHQDSRLKIIHRDLKASNVLLDAALNPKISDFGMARMFQEEQIQANTKRVVGTYGYMSPEYAMEGLYSIKSDVFSYGILLLEVISGKRNSYCHDKSVSLNLIGYVWDLWREGKALDIVDSSLEQSYPAQDVLRCIHIGLLCVQEFAKDRPTMSEVVSMLGNETTLPSPEKPAFVPRRNNNSPQSSRTRSGRAPSVNGVTMTTIEGR